MFVDVVAVQYGVTSQLCQKISFSTYVNIDIQIFVSVTSTSARVDLQITLPFHSFLTLVRHLSTSLTKKISIHSFFTEKDSFISFKKKRPVI